MIKLNIVLIFDIVVIKRGKN